MILKVRIMIRLVLTLILLGFISSSFAQDTTSYSFFIAGHVYGAPGVNNQGMYPPFKDKFDYIKGRNEIKFGILTGDIVSPNPIEQDWIEIDADIDTLGLPVYFAVGNHDMENRPVFENRYGKSYFSFNFRNDLFIILDPNIDSWNISGAQKDFLENTVTSNHQMVDNIFVLFHQLLWWEKDNIYFPVAPNSFAGKADTINFWTEIEPIFNQLSNNVVFCAGDLGAGSWSSNFMYDTYDNITFLASGMGDGDGDNFIVINIDSSKNIDYDLICLDEPILECFGDLNDHQISLSVTEQDTQTEVVKVYPNPARQFVTLELGTPSSTMVQLFDMIGQLVMEKQFPNKGLRHDIDLTLLPKGVYLLNISSNSNSRILKLLVD